MSFKAHCEANDIRLRDEDYLLIKSSLMCLETSLWRGILEEYVTVYGVELEKVDKNNYARHALARHYANRWFKFHVSRLSLRSILSERR